MSDTRVMQRNGDVVKIYDLGSAHVVEEDVLFLDNLRNVENLSTVRLSYNTIVFCHGGRILVEVGGNQQVKVKPGQLLLIPTGKLVQPMLVSTDVEATALMVSDKMLRSFLGNQIDIWNKALYMKEIYVVEDTTWLKGLQTNIQAIFQGHKQPLLYREILFSFMRTILLVICDNLMRHEGMVVEDDTSTPHDKEIFDRFLSLLSSQKQKRQKVSFYANLLNITPKHLSTACKKVSSKNPMRWIAESVMEDSYALLRDTNLSVKEISNRLGFPNSSFFGQYFREQAGVTPMEYRAEHKKIA